MRVYPLARASGQRSLVADLTDSDIDVAILVDVLLHEFEQFLRVHTHDVRPSYPSATRLIKSGADVRSSDFAVLRACIKASLRARWQRAVGRLVFLKAACSPMKGMGLPEADEETPVIFHSADVPRSVATLIDLSMSINLYIYKLAQSNTGSEMIYSDPLPGGSTLVNIQRVREKNAKKFLRIVENFPYDWSITDQSAYVLRAYSGLQLFPDANHRTGLAISRAHLQREGYFLRATSSDWKQLVHDLKDQHGKYRSRCKVDVIRTRNSCFEHVAEFYEAHTKRHTTITKLIDRMFPKYTQGPPSLAFLDDETPEEQAARKAMGETEAPES